MAETESAPAIVQTSADLMARVVVGGDLSKLPSRERLQYYQAICNSAGRNPLTRPFEYTTLNGKLTLYAKKDATGQLRDIHNVSIDRLDRETVEGVYTVTAYAKNGKGRVDTSIGAVAIEGLKGEARANAIMKAETKAKRRVTLSICGLGLLDETEVETIPGSIVDTDAETRDKLRVQIGELADAAGWTDEAKKKLWREKFADKRPPDVTLADLADFLAHVRELTK